MKVVRNCLLLATAITAALVGVSPATAAPAAAPVGTITESPVSGSPPLFGYLCHRAGFLPYSGSSST